MREGFHRAVYEPARGFGCRAPTRFFRRCLKVVSAREIQRVLASVVHLAGPFHVLKPIA